MPRYTGDPRKFIVESVRSMARQFRVDSDTSPGAMDVRSIDLADDNKVYVEVATNTGIKIFRITVSEVRSK